MISQNPRNVLFVTPLLRAREIKMAAGLRKAGWTVILLFSQNTPFNADVRFDEVIQAQSDADMHKIAKLLRPALCHVFSGAVDDVILQFCRDKPSAVVIDMNDVFTPSLFNYCEERFEPTKECLELADGLCARDLQANYARLLDGRSLPSKKIFFPEYCWNETSDRDEKGNNDEEVRVVSIGTFCLEKQGLYDSGYLKLARLLTDQRIHFHIYPHWFYRPSPTSSFNWSLEDDFSDFFDLQKETPYLHIHKSVPLDQLAAELPQYDFGIVSGGSAELDQTLSILKKPYLDSCYSGRIADYLDAGLPVLVNPEVRFNFRLMKRYGVLVDLDDLHKDGFREKLLELKNDSALSTRVKRVAGDFSLDANTPRLSAFYDAIIAGRDLRSYRPGSLELVLSHIPVIRRATQKAGALLDKCISVLTENESLRVLVDDLNAAKGQLYADLNVRDKQIAALESKVVDGERRLERVQARTTELVEKMKGTLTVGRAMDAKAEGISEMDAATLLQKRNGKPIVEQSSEALDGVVADLVQLVKAQAHQLEHLETECVQISQQRDEFSAEAFRLNENNRAQRLEVAQLRSEKDVLADKLASNAASELNAADAEEEVLNSQLRQLADENETLAKKVDELGAKVTTFRNELEISGHTADELSGLLGWPEIRDENERLNGFYGLLNINRIFFENTDEFSRYSEAWTALSRKNFDQLLRDGFNNFKRTIATNYFTFIVQEGDPQIAALESLLSDTVIENCRLAARGQPDSPELEIPDQFSYRYFVQLLWAYTQSVDVDGYLQKVREPLLGNPFRIFASDTLISQDLANSTLEYMSMSEGVDFAACERVLEIGGGYGRNAYVTLTLNPHVKYFCVDVPPSIFVAQKYIAKLFPERTVFSVQDFSSYESVKDQMDNASVVFLLPHQLEMLPDDHFNLAVSISNLGEMTKSQIARYTRLIGRVTKGHVYNKQWNSSINPFDDQVIESGEYPVLEGWREVYTRYCATNPDFFESLHEVEATQ